MKNYLHTIFFIVIFISAVSIIAILIARGYTISEDQIIENGILNIASSPKDTIIFINNKETARSPEKIELAPGKYMVKLTKDGYNDWQKEVEVEATVVTDINPDLFPTDLSLEQITTTSIDKVFFSNDSTIAVYIVSEKPNKGIWLSRLEKSIFAISRPQPTKILNIGNISTQCIHNKNYNIIIADDNSQAIMQCPAEKLTTFYYLTLDSSNTPALNINKEIGFNPTKVMFGFDNKDLLIIDNDVITNFNVQTRTHALISRKKTDFPAYITPFGNNFLLLEYSYDNKSQHLYKLTSNLKKTIINLPSEIRNKSIVAISGSANTQDIMVVSTTKSSYILNLKDIASPISILLSEESVTVDTWSKNSTSLLFQETDCLKTAIIKDLFNGDIALETYTFIENYDSSKYELSWTNNSRQVLVNDLGNKQFYIKDYDEDNRQMLFDGEAAHSRAFKLSENETFLVLLLQDDKQYSNLYSIKLKI